MKRTNGIKRIRMFVLNIVMVLVLLSGMGAELVEVQADTVTAEVRDVNLGTGGFSNPTSTTGEAQGWAGSKVYYGDKLWRVLDPSKDSNGGAGSAFLFSDGNLSQGVYNTGMYSHATWNTCELRKSLNGENNTGNNGTMLGDIFSSMERSAIQITEVANNKGGQTSDKLFLLSNEEVIKTVYGFGNNSTRAEAGEYPHSWWLRSTSNEGDQWAYTVEVSGRVPSYGTPIWDGDVTVHPAFNLGQSSVLFSSASTFSKTDGFAEIKKDAVSNNIWKLTLNAKDDTTFTANLPEKGMCGGEVSVDVTAAGSGSVDYTQTSAMLVDGSGAVAAYGKIGNAEKGKMSFKIPPTISPGGYTLKVFPEQVNDGNLTDYAGNVVEKNITIESQQINLGIEAPKENVPLAGTAVCNDAGVKEKNPAITWTCGSEEAEGNARYNTIYTASVTLTPADGNVFTANTIATVGEQSATAKLNDNEGTLTITYTYDKTAPRDNVKDPYYATKDDLMDYYNLSDGTIGKIRFGSKYNSEVQLWAICGREGSELALMGTSPIGTSDYGTDSRYSKSKLLSYIESDLNSNFTEKERNKMQAVTVFTNEPKEDGSGNELVEVKDKKLYLPNSKNENSLREKEIYVGSSNTIKIEVSKLTGVNGFTGSNSSENFWLRSPNGSDRNSALIAGIGGSNNEIRETSPPNPAPCVVYVFHLNLSTVSFASAAEAASSDGFTAKTSMTENTFTP